MCLSRMFLVLSPLVLLAACSGGGGGLQSVMIDPAEPRTSDPLVLRINGGPAGSVETRWSLDGQHQPELDGATEVGSALTAKGQEWRVSVAPAGGGPSTGPQASVSVLNTPPEIAGAFVRPEAPRRGDELSCAGVGWFDPDGDEPAFEIAWSTGATGPTLSTADMEVGDSVYCVATPFDGEDLGEPKTSETVVLGQDGPVVLTVVLPSDLKTGDDVVPSFTYLPDEGSLSFAYDWMVNGSSVSAEPVLSRTRTAKGDRVQVAITPSQGDMVGEPMVSNEVTIQNTPPVIDSLTVDPSSPGTDQSVTAVVSDSDPDPSDTLTRAFSWTVGGTAVPAATSPTLSSANYRKGDVIRARVVVSDGTDSVEAESDPVTVVNSPPTAPVIAIEGSAEDEDLRCMIVRESTDPDEGDRISYRYGWLVDGRATGETSERISAEYTEHGQRWTCEVHAVDDEGARSPVARVTVTIGGGDHGGCVVSSTARSHISLSRAEGKLLDDLLYVTNEDDFETRVSAFMFFPFEDRYPYDHEEITRMELEISFVDFDTRYEPSRTMAMGRPEEPIPWDSEEGPYEHLAETEIRPHLTLPIERSGPGRQILYLDRELVEELEIPRFWEEMMAFTLAIGGGEEPMGEKYTFYGTFTPDDAPVLRLYFEGCEE